MKAHLTLFHQLPDEAATIDHLRNLKYERFELRVTGLKNLGAGVAYIIESPELSALHKNLSILFRDILIPQDKQGFRPHIVVMNKTTPARAKTLFAELSENFKPFDIAAAGLDLWIYRGGPWAHKISFETM